MAVKPLITTTVQYHDGTDPIVFADAIVDNKASRDGTIARQQILDEKTVEAVGTIGNGEAKKYILPYHSVIYVSVEKTSGETTPAEDAFCVKE